MIVKHYRILILGTLLFLLFYGLFHILFVSKSVPDVNWTTTFNYDDKEPNGCWLFHEILKKSYGAERVVKLDRQNIIPPHSDSINKGYLYIGDYFAFDQDKLENLSGFVKKGDDAIIIVSDFGYYTDSLFRQYFSYYGRQDSLLNLQISGDTTAFSFSYYEFQFDSSVFYFHNVLDSLDKNDVRDIEVLSYFNDSLPVFIKMKYGLGHFYIHMIPDAFTNLGIKKGGMKDYVINVMPLLNIDTLYLDNDQYGAIYSGADSPLQYIISQPKLKWSYYIVLLGLLLFAISRGQRRQRIIRTIDINENTSLEYVHTLSELYRAQNQHYKLAIHLKSLFSQWIRKKYFIKPDEENYIRKIAHKSKMPEDEIQRLINRINSAVGNKRFGEEQLKNLYNDLDHFYKNCK